MRDVPIQVRCCCDPGELLGYVWVSAEQWQELRKQELLRFPIGFRFVQPLDLFKQPHDAPVHAEARVVELPLRRFCHQGWHGIASWLALDSHETDIEDLRRIPRWEDAREDFEYLMDDRAILTRAELVAKAAADLEAHEREEAYA